MDYSFCSFLEPRKTPEPTSFLKNSLDSLVPDVSIIEKTSDPNASYNSWKSKNIVVPYSKKDFNKENNKNVSNIRKQVSFNISQNNSFDNEFSSKNGNFDKTKLQTPPASSLINRELELSLLDNKRSNYPNVSNCQIYSKNEEYIKKPKSYHEWLRTMEQEKKYAELKNKKPEPTVNDLYKMVHDQNTSLKNLQKQVETLLQQNSQQQMTKIDENFTNKMLTTEIMCSCKCNKTVCMKNVETNTSLNPVQVSVGVMTSFQINLNSENVVTSPNNNAIAENVTKDILLGIKNDTNQPTERYQTHLEIDRHQTRFPNKPFNLGAYNSNLTNSIEGVGSKFREYSLSEIPEIPEPLDETMSTSASIHVDLQEFQESSDEEKVENNDMELQENNIGWTVYNNVVGQVKNILNSSPKENDTNLNKNDPNIILTENIKMSALSQIQELGISLADLNMPMLLDSEFLYKNQKATSNDMSIKVNQLVMKYLKDDQLSFLVTKNQLLQASPSQKYCRNSPNNEISFSTVKYMQKYRLWGQISKSPEQFEACNVQKVMTNREYTQNQRYISQNKILDITALKQQPKLL